MAEAVEAPPAPGRRFYLWLGVITALALAWQVLYVLVWRHDAVIGGDSFFYHQSANLIADGRGWINPFDYTRYGIVNQAADHPPLYLLYLAFWSWLGLTSPLSHMLVSTLIGAGTVYVAGLAGRQILGRRVGLIAAVLMATYPNIWSWDGMLLSEAMAVFTVVLTLWLAYRFWHRPTLLGAIAMGISVAAATLSRAELLLLSVLIVVPLVLTVRSKPWRIRVGWLAAAGAACVAALAPWVGYNLSRFERPVYLSNGFEITLASATCDDTFYGPTTGYWSIQCPLRFMEANGFEEVGGDQSLRAEILRRESLDYLDAHRGRIPVVVLARWGRITGLWHPVQQAQLDHYPEGREQWIAYAGLGWWYPLVAFAIVGGIALRRRRVPVYPLLAPVITVALIVTILFAQNRYRASAEPAITLLAAVGVDATCRALARRRDRAAPAGAADASPPKPTGTLSGDV